jgi:hypothetical protein
MQNLGRVRRDCQRRGVTDLAKVMLSMLKRRAKHAARTELPVAGHCEMRIGPSWEIESYQGDELEQTGFDVLDLGI